MGAKEKSEHNFRHKNGFVMYSLEVNALTLFGSNSVVVVVESIWEKMILSNQPNSTQSQNLTTRNKKKKKER